MQVKVIYVHDIRTGISCGMRCGVDGFMEFRNGRGQGNLRVTSHRKLVKTCTSFLSLLLYSQLGGFFEKQPFSATPTSLATTKLLWRSWGEHGWAGRGGFSLSREPQAFSPPNAEFLWESLKQLTNHISPKPQPRQMVKRSRLLTAKDSEEVATFYPSFHQIP